MLHLPLFGVSDLCEKTPSYSFSFRTAEPLLPLSGNGGSDMNILLASRGGDVQICPHPHQERQPFRPSFSLRPPKPPQRPHLLCPSLDLGSVCPPTPKSPCVSVILPPIRPLFSISIYLSLSSPLALPFLLCWFLSFTEPFPHGKCWEQTLADP